ncbi:hypothetical protein GC174_10655 [bacterium]|nr:hypothetical protein [bacterium]
MPRAKSILLSLPMMALFGILSTASLPAVAGPNDFFGSAVPNAATGSAQPEEANPYAETPMPEGDFTEDEQRMQKRFKEKVKHAKNLLEKGKKMVEEGEKKNNKKMVSRGKIFAEIGERELKALAANNPLNELISPTQKAALEQKETKEKEKKSKDKTASNDSDLLQ